MWKTIKDFPDYEVSDTGVVRSKDRLRKFGRQFRMVHSQEISPYDHTGGYLCVKLAKEGKKTNQYVHRLVAKEHIDNVNNLPEVNHKDGNRKNNSVDNLEWVTRQGNIDHALYRAKGEMHGRHILTEDEVRMIRRSSEASSALVAALGVKYATIWAIRARKIWRHVEG